MTILIYFDHAATTRVCAEAAQAAVEAMTNVYGNPSSRYPLGMQAAAALESHRATVADALGCLSEELYFTSCGTESDNWAIRAAVEYGRRRGRHIVTTAIEHDAVLQPMKALQRQGYEVTFLQPDRSGSIDPQEVEQAIRPDTILVSMMLVNNELGTILPVRSAREAIDRCKSPALLHTDAVQGFLKLDCTPAALGVDLLSISGHKVHAPKGVGALYIRKGLSLPALLLGGGQERGLRSGTEATAQIAALAAACEALASRRDAAAAHCQKLKRHLLARLEAELPSVSPIVSNGIPQILALTMTGYKSEVLVRVLGDEGICVSAGSACHRGKPSHVYAALPLSRAQRDGAFRVSLDESNTLSEVDALVDALIRASAMLFPSMS